MPVGLFLLLIYGTARQSSGAAREGQPVQEKFNGAIKTARNLGCAAAQLYILEF